MRICIIVTHYLPHIGGLENLTEHMARELLSLGHEVHIITPQASETDDFASNGYYIHRILIKGYPGGYPEGPRITVFLRAILFFKKAINCISEIKPDIIQAQNITNSLPAYLAGKIYHIPFCIGIHGEFEMMGPWLPVRLSRIWPRLPYIKKASTIIVSTKKFQKKANEKLHRNTVIIPNGVDTSVFFPNKYNSNEHFTIVTVARLDRFKGLEYAIKSMKTVCTTYPNARLTIVGEGDIFQELEQLIDSLNLNGSVSLLGKRTHNEVAAIMKNSNLYLCTSLFEGFGIVLIEAMACGLPIVSTPVGVAPELIHKFKNGILIDFKDDISTSEAIKFIINNPKLSGIYAENSLKGSKKYSWETMGKMYEGVYLQAIMR